MIDFDITTIAYILAAGVVLWLIALLRRRLRPRSKYQRYLNSWSWSRTRIAARLRDGWRCRSCHVRGSRLNPLNTHHVSYQTYDRYGYTKLSEVVTLCQKCHHRYHRTGQLKIHSQLFWFLFDLGLFAAVIVVISWYCQ